MRHSRLPKRQHLSSKRNHLRIRRIFDVHLKGIGGHPRKNRRFGLRIEIQPISLRLSENGSKSTRSRAERSSLRKVLGLALFFEPFGFDESRCEMQPAGLAFCTVIRVAKLQSQNQPIGIQNVRHPIAVDPKLPGAVPVQNPHQILGKLSFDLLHVVIRLARQRIDDQRSFPLPSVAFFPRERFVALSVRVPGLAPVEEEEVAAAQFLWRFYGVGVGEVGVAEGGNGLHISWEGVEVGGAEDGVFLGKRQCRRGYDFGGDGGLGFGLRGRVGWGWRHVHDPDGGGGRLVIITFGGQSARRSDIGIIGSEPARALKCR
mmetsp:Transcript_13907/g.29352  ORF Transcript_13907/g.29352 Transcript_13907/m.29352 type:complete len:317 (-) Transcript_13907:111-1061(-)